MDNLETRIVKWLDHWHSERWEDDLTHTRPMFADGQRLLQKALSSDPKPPNTHELGAELVFLEGIITLQRDKAGERVFGVTLETREDVDHTVNQLKRDFGC